ncbi:uncharacterized protein METZ01_LOCUS98464, partial [marine metagenome]
MRHAVQKVRVTLWLLTTSLASGHLVLHKSHP